MAYPQYQTPLSSELWNAAAVGANGQSPTFDASNGAFVSIWGNASGATTITVMYSRTGASGTWYAGPTKVLAGSGNFEFDLTTGAQFLALQTTNAVTLTAFISAK